ncbi:MAG: T9SS C-terminal target domain-containing protein, partial [Cytophagia bacterium]|nr:T9SS C-terminal target domain-containing protein [Cytophagia bacterium]
PVSQFSGLSDLTDNTPLATAFCEDVPLNFNAAASTIASGSISSYSWNFGDINATGSNPNEATGVSTKHTFTQSLKYNVSLVTTSTFGCSNTFSTAITIGSIPVANFSFEGVSSIVTTNLSTIGNPGLESTPGVFPNTLTASSSVFSDYTSPTGVFDVTLTVTSAGGCVNEITKTVVVVPKKSPSASSAFEDNFETNTNQNDWIPFGANVSWQRGTAAKTTIQNGDANGVNVWVTKLSGAYNASEASALYSPNFDLTGLDRPIITFDLFTDLDDIDGVVLEYSTDNLNIADPNKVWNRLGSFADQESTGVEWYNKVGIAARPGDQSDGDYGWTETATSWRTAKHKLNDANGPLNNNAQIVFRFAFASTSTVKTKDGFAIDNVRIGNGTRTVLVEGFTNSGSTDVRIASENEVIRNFVSESEGVEIIKVNYHAAFPGADPFNAMNPDDPGARALYYGIASVPNARLDGDIPEGQNLMFSDWGQREFDKRILDLADADINVSLNRTGLESDSIVVTFSPLIDLTNRATILHVMVVEQEVLSSLNSSIGAVPSGETEFSYVLRKMLPNAAGTKFTSLTKDSQHRLALAWADGSAFAPEDDISVVVFLQDEITKAVYQSYIVRDLGNPKVVTAIEEPAFNSFEVYPNPADRELVITLPEIVTKQTPLVMFDQMGKVVHETVFEKGEQSKEIGTDSLAAGVYLIKVESSQGKLMKKVVITHR